MKDVKIPNIIAAVVLLLLAFGSLPYDYERIGQWIILAAAAYTIYVAYEKNKQGWLWCMIFLVILYNPFAPVEFKRKVWQFIDVLTAIAFFIASKLP